MVFHNKNNNNSSAVFDQNDVRSRNNQESNENLSFYERFLKAIWYYYHRMAIGFYEDALAYDLHELFTRDQLFGQKQKYGGDIPFIGPTKLFDRRHYRDWVTIETPTEMVELADEFGNFPDKVDFYTGGYLDWYLQIDPEEFDRGLPEFHYAFPGNYERPATLDYNLTEHPRNPELHVWYYKYPFLFPDPNPYHNVYYQKGYYNEEWYVFVPKVSWDLLVFVWLEVLRLPVLNLNPEGWLRRWWDQARDAYGDELEDDDDSGLPFCGWFTCGSFLIWSIDDWGPDYWDFFWVKGSIVFSLVFIGTFLDQALASFRWYTFFKDHAALTSLHFNHFAYHEVFMCFFFTLGFPKYALWYGYGTVVPSEFLFRRMVYAYLKNFGYRFYKKYYKKHYYKEAWCWYHKIAMTAKAWHQFWYEQYNSVLYYTHTIRATWFTCRRNDMIYFNLQLQRYPYYNTLDFFRPPKSLSLDRWIFDHGAIWKAGDRDYLAGSQYWIYMRMMPKSRNWISNNMRPIDFTITRAPWLWEPDYYHDAAQSYQLGFQDPATPIMEGIIDLHHDLFFFFVVIGGLVFWLLFRIVSLFSWEGYVVPENFYRKVTHHTTAEVVWTVLPALILVMIATPSFSLLYAMEDIIKPSLTVKVIGNQWYWTYEYFARSFYNESNPMPEEYNDAMKALLKSTESKPIEKIFDSYMVDENDLQEGELRLLEVDNRVIVPTFTHIRFLITSSDVLHSFAVPSLGIKLDACPGRLNQTTAFITRQGLFYGQCSEICGINHAFMPIVVEAVDKGTMLGWLFK